MCLSFLQGRRGGADAWHGRAARACYCSIVIGDGSECSLRGNNTSNINILVHLWEWDRHCYLIVINNGPAGGWGGRAVMPSDQIALAAMFTVSASNAVLKKNETTPWAITVRRIGCDATATSDTWQVMPTTKEK
jgi:hypothetical protein